MEEMGTGVLIFTWRLSRGGPRVMRSRVEAVSGSKVR
jgi:hypothetical protein